MLDVTLCETAPWSQVFALECASLPALPPLPHNPPLSPSPHCLTLVPHPLLPRPTCPGCSASTELSLIILEEFINLGFRPCLNTPGVYPW